MNEYNSRDEIKGSPGVPWIIGKLKTKYKGPKSGDKEVICLVRKF